MHFHSYFPSGTAVRSALAEQLPHKRALPFPPSVEGGEKTTLLSEIKTLNSEHQGSKKGPKKVKTHPFSAGPEPFSLIFDERARSMPRLKHARGLFCAGKSGL